MRRRRVGFTLIELTVVLTILSLVWLSVTGVLYTLYRADQRVRDDLQHEHAFDRFAMRLRLDAHAANSANLLELADGGHELVLTSASDRAIHYGMTSAGIYRIVRQGEVVLHRDAFIMGRATVQWELHSPEEPALIVLTWTSRDERTKAARVRQIKAAVASTSGAIAKAPETSS